MGIIRNSRVVSEQHALRNRDSEIQRSIYPVLDFPIGGGFRTNLCSIARKERIGVYGRCRSTQPTKLL